MECTYWHGVAKANLCSTTCIHPPGTLRICTRIGTLSAMAVSAQRIDLHSGWSFKRTDADEDDWAPVAHLPTVVHMDLLENKKEVEREEWKPQPADLLTPPLGSLIPSLARMSWMYSGVGEHSWTYQTTFSAPQVPSGASAYLLFDGLDTFAHVRLNGKSILQSDNMFRSHRVDITDALDASGPNHLVIDFDSALLRGRQLEKEHPEYRFIAHNGETGLLGVRKAQYHCVVDCLLCSNI